MPTYKQMKEFVEIAGVLKRFSQSGKAILFDCGLTKDVWIPVSQIENENDELGEGVEIELIIPEWLAKDKEMI